MASIKMVLSRALTAVLGLAVILAVAPPVAAADAPSSCSTALPTSPTGIWVADGISTDGDVDWFEFSLTSDQLVLVTLGRLPAPYRLELFSSCGTSMKVSDRLGTIYEEIAIALTAGTYYVKVSGDGRQYFPGGDPTFHPRTYRLKFRPISSGVVVLSHDAYPHGGFPDVEWEIFGEVLNNTSEHQTDVTVTATYYDSSNNVLGTRDAVAYLDILKPGARSPFKIDEVQFPGYDHYKVRVSSATMTTTKPVAVTALNREWTVDSPSTIHFTGTIENEHTFTVVSPKVAVTLYTTLGKVRDAEAAFTEASSLAPGEQSAFDVIFSDYHRWYHANRRVHSSQASR